MLLKFGGLLNAEGGQPVTFCHGLKLKAPDGKQHADDFAQLLHIKCLHAAAP